VIFPIFCFPSISLDLVGDTFRSVALERVTEDLRTSTLKVEGKVTVLVFLDFKKAFDFVDNSSFLSKLVSTFDPRGLWCPHF
jgi:hypothetical protein